MTRWGAGGVPFVDPCHDIVGKTGLVMVAVQGAPLVGLISEAVAAFAYLAHTSLVFFLPHIT